MAGEGRSHEAGSLGVGAGCDLGLLFVRRREERTTEERALLGLTYELDYKGNICGSRHGDPDLHELDVRYWMNPNQVYQSGVKDNKINLADAKAICLMECPIPAADGLNFHWQQMGGINIDENILIDKTIHKAINSKSSVLKRYVADIGKSWPVLIVCAGWLGNDPLTVVIGESDPYVHITGREISHLHAATVVMTVVMIIAFLSSIAIIRRILIATPVLKVAAKVIGEVQALIIFPVVPYFIFAIFYMFWFSATLHLFSSGQVLRNDCNTDCCSYDLKLGKVNCDNCCGYSIHYTPHIGIAILFHLFGCYWATQFFIACSSTVIAGSVASYYWARGEISHDIPFVTVVSSLKRLLRYSLGSVAIGSLVVSAVEWVRFILECLRRKLKLFDSARESCFGKMTSSSSQCCLGCIDWTLKSVNRNAYIMIAITGKGFFKASVLATGLIMNNILRIGKVNVIGDVILFLGKLCVSLFCALFAFLMLDTHKYKSAHNKISSPLVPVVVSWALGFIVAKLFFQVVEMSIDTIILSFCQDSEEHQGNAQYAPPLLVETLDEQSELHRLTQGP
ncbi:hypothetical protein OsJ_16656 [Oryza sativa Japonica Group]|uniref:Choline transporter-like protein n=1 Tax=Oryza sativa subsp. japonica TaxID=39947 RepID=B9FDC4_ORYSJ|nr:hypothetical protein OsJ_16656 [Oryza sativa Japonica Group]